MALPAPGVVDGGLPFGCRSYPPSGALHQIARYADVAPRSRSQLTSCSRRVSVLPAIPSAV